MKAKKIKLIAIIALVIINIVFAVLISQKNNYEEYYSTEDLKRLSQILTDSNIIVPDSILYDKKVVLNSYLCNSSMDSLIDVVRRVYGNNSYYLGDNTLSFEHNDGVLEFNINTVIYYKNNDYSVESLETLISVSDISQDIINGFTNKVKNFLSYSKIQSDMLNKANKCDIVLSSVQKTRRGNYYLTFFQKIGDKTIINPLYVTIEEDTIVQIEGEMFVVFPNESITSENTSLIDILLSEKRYFDNLETNITHTVSGLKYYYELCYDGYSKYYLVPICSIEYTTGLVRNYDLVTGYLINKK